MRTVYLDSLKPGDITGKFDKSHDENHWFELRNRMGHTIYFIDPKLKRTLTYGVIITDENCTRQNRLFGDNISLPIKKSDPPLKSSRLRVRR